MTNELLDKAYAVSDKIHTLEISLDNLKRSGRNGVRIGQRVGMSCEVGLGDDYQRVIDMCEFLLEHQLKEAKKEFEEL